MDQGVFVAGTTVSSSQGSLSLLTNPAGLASQQHLELRLQGMAGGSEGLAARGAGWGLVAGVPFGPFGLGASVEHVRDPAPGAKIGPATLDVTRASFGGGLTIDRWFHLGAAARILTAQADEVGSVFTTDVGMVLTPWSWFSVGAQVSDLVGATRFLLPAGVNAITGPQSRWGVAFRYKDIACWNVDLGWPSVAPLTLVSTTLSVRLSESYVVLAAYRHTSHNQVVTGDATGFDGRVTVALRWTTETLGAEAGFARDFPSGAARASGLAVGARIRKRLRTPLWSRALAAFGAVRDGTGTTRAGRGRPKAPGAEMTMKELRDVSARSQLGWQAPYKGAYKRESAKIATTIIAFSNALAAEDRDSLCRLLAPAELRFDIETTQPKLRIHANMERAAACRSLVDGQLGTYVKEFGPAHAHADMATVIPALFTIHGSPYLHLPEVQLRAYSTAFMNHGDRRERIRCDAYRASRLPADAMTPKEQRRYEISIGCKEVGDYHIEVIGNRRKGFRVRKFALRRNGPPR